MANQGAFNFLGARAFDYWNRDNLGLDEVATGTGAGGQLGSFISSATDAAYRNLGADPHSVATAFASPNYQRAFRSAFQAGDGFDAYKGAFDLADRAREGGRPVNLNFANATDGELTDLYNAGGGAQSGLGGQFGSLMQDRHLASKTANDAYQQYTLGGNYAGGLLPDSGYKGNEAGSFGTFGSLGSSPFSTGQTDTSQPTGFGYPGSGGFQGWGGPAKPGGMGGLGGFPAYKNPFEPV